MKKIFLAILMLLSINVAAQIDYYEHPDKPPKDSTENINSNFYAGGNISVSIINPWGLYLTPAVAYHLAPWYSTGVSSDFIYVKYQNYSPMIYYGVGVFDEFYVLNTVVFHAEVKYFNVYDYLAVKRVWTPAYYLGGGYKQNFGKKSYLTYLLLWDFNYNSNSVYRNPVLRIVFYFNF